MNFLHQLFEEGLSYSGINSARSALSSVIQPTSNITFGNHPLVTKYLKGVFNARPSLPRYKHVWDVAVVLKYLQSLDPPETLSLKDLTLKVTMLLALLSSQRCQTLQCLNISHMMLSADKCTFQIKDLLKTSKPGHHFGQLEFHAYTEDKKLCIIQVLKEYINRTRSLRGESTQLLLSYCKPHKPVTSETIGKWLKVILSKSGIDVNLFGAHSTRSASTSAAKLANIPITQIMDAAGWRQSETFRRFYDKPITKDSNENFGTSLLNATDISH